MFTTEASIAALPSIFRYWLPQYCRPRAVTGCLSSAATVPPSPMVPLESSLMRTQTAALLPTAADTRASGWRIAAATMLVSDVQRHVRLSGTLVIGQRTDITCSLVRLRVSWRRSDACGQILTNIRTTF